MINRRAAISAVLGAPVAAKAAVETGVNEVMGGYTSSVLDDEEFPTCEPDDPIKTAARMFLLDRSNRARDAFYRQDIKMMPVSISSKKSWSDEFKQTVYVEMRRRFEEEHPDYWEMSTEELIAFAIKRGFKP